MPVKHIKNIDEKDNDVEHKVTLCTFQPFFGILELSLYGKKWQEHSSEIHI